MNGLVIHGKLNPKLDSMIKNRVAFLVTFTIVSVFALSCVKSIQPSEVEGVWKSVKEDWTIVNNGATSTESYDYGELPTEQSAILKLTKTSFDLLSSTETKTFYLEYSDRFLPWRITLLIAYRP